MSAFYPAQILLPKKGIDPGKWAVIACDQFTSEPEYWERLDRMVGANPSTLRLILPEVYLERGCDTAIRTINLRMEEYLNAGILLNAGSIMVLVVRSTPFTKKRLGLVLAVDLEAYSYTPGEKPLIRATEQTVASRIPPRVKIREHAAIELPHVLLLINDKIERVIENLYENRDNLEMIYDFDLNQEGGHLTGYKVIATRPVIDRLNKLIAPLYSEKMYRDKDAMLLALVGDGNHSLASAKVHWENVKQNLSAEEQKTHPARFALVEVENIYDEGLKFEPIHRVVFHAGSDFLDGLRRLEDGDYQAEIYTREKGSEPFYLSMIAPQSIKLVQDYIDDYIKQHPEVKVDYVHGLDHLHAVCDKEEGAIGITLPPLRKEDLFPYVLRNGVLPRKSFSMGEAVEKRYYFESKRITK